MFYVSTTFIDDHKSVHIAINKLLEKNIKNIELGSNHIWEKKLKFNKNNFINFCVHNYFPVPKKSMVLNVASQNLKIRKKSIKRIKNSILFSKMISAKLYTFHPGFLTDPKGSNIAKNNYDFLWNSKKLINANYDRSWKKMIQSLKEIVKFAKQHKVTIAIETEGSLSAKNHLLMQKPEEFKRLFKQFKKEDLGVNLNIGHLNLASKAFKFNKFKFIKTIQKYIKAMEISHNYGKNDDHLPVKRNSWYWKIIKDEKYDKIPKILEFRNTDVNEIKKIYDMLNK
tara:strand:- start:1063 stop:1911 length:849 start_codon:yes stop_codon:yes gene_type:complete